MVSLLSSKITLLDLREVVDVFVTLACKVSSVLSTVFVLPWPTDSDRRSLSGAFFSLSIAAMFKLVFRRTCVFRLVTCSIWPVSELRRRMNALLFVGVSCSAGLLPSDSVSQLPRSSHSSSVTNRAHSLKPLSSVSESLRK